MILLFYILLALIAAASPSGELDGGQDWSQCPPACKCKWASGKRTADCEAAGLDSLPLFPRPDLIQVLVMDHNPLKTLPPRAFHLTGLINVQKVFMKNCSLHDLDPTALGGLVILIELDLSDNHIKELKQGTFRGNVRLRKLRMASNELSSLARFSFPSMGHLRLIDLSYNRLTKIDAATFSNLGNNLEVLHLNNNRFRRLSVRPFLALHTLKSLRIENNPWFCDCKLRDFWYWLQAKRLLLAFNGATCIGPKKLKGHGLHDLDSEEHLACAPLVSVPQPRVPVTRGGNALLPCRLEEGEAAEVTWLREGIPVKANLSSEAVIYGQYYVIFIGQRWYNLSIQNIEPPTSSDLYTCLASNEGGISEANVTLVHSPNVATYVGDGEAVISWLLTGGVASGVLIFLLLSIWLLFCSVQRARQRGLVTTAKPTSEALSNSNLLANEHHEIEPKSMSASVEAIEATIEAASFEEQQLRQTTAVARAQRLKNESERPFPDLLPSVDCHQNNYIEMAENQPQQQQQPPPPPFYRGPHQIGTRIYTPTQMTTSTFGLQPPRGYSRSSGGQLSDPDSGCFSDTPMVQPWSNCDVPMHNQQMLMSSQTGDNSSSSPLSSSGSSMMSTVANTRLLAHTLENRKRVLHTLREKSDTLV